MARLVRSLHDSVKHIYMQTLSVKNAFGIHCFPKTHWGGTSPTCTTPCHVLYTMSSRLLHAMGFSDHIRLQIFMTLFPGIKPERRNFSVSGFILLHILVTNECLRWLSFVPKILASNGYFWNNNAFLNAEKCAGWCNRKTIIFCYTFM